MLVPPRERASATQCTLRQATVLACARRALRDNAPSPARGSARRKALQSGRWRIPRSQVRNFRAEVRKGPKGPRICAPPQGVGGKQPAVGGDPPLARSCAAIERVLPGRPLAVNSQPLAATSPLAKSCPAVAVALRLRSRKSETTSNHSKTASMYARQ